MKFFVTGSAGLVGSQVVKNLTANGDTIYSGYHNSKPQVGIPTKIDLLDTDEIIKIIEKINPDAVIHLAAVTDVDLCEREKDLAMKINANATEIISKQAAKQGAFLVYVSTDYVFSGEKELKKETDPTNPLNFYGKSKLQGEKSVMNMASSWCIARTSTPFGIHWMKKSFPSWIVQSLLENKEITVVSDQYTSPTYVPNLSRMLIEVAKRQITGVIHLAGSTRISRYKMAELIVKTLNIEKKLLRSTTINEVKWYAKRPKDSSLDVSKASSILREKPIEVEKGLSQFLQELKLHFGA